MDRIIAKTTSAMHWSALRTIPRSRTRLNAW